MTSQFDWSKYKTVEAPETQSSFDWSQYKQIPEEEDKYAGLSPRQKFSQRSEEFAQKLIEPGARVVKGMARGAAHLPATIASLPAQLLDLLTAGQVPGLPQVAQYLNQPLAWEPALEQQLQKTISPAQTPGQRSLESGGQQFMNLLGLGVAPQAAIPAVLGGELLETGTEAIAPTAAPGLKEALGFLGQIPGLLHGEFRPDVKPLPSKSGLEIPQIAQEAKKSKFLSPKILPGRKEKIMEKISQDATKLTEEIKKRELPIAKQIEQGIDVAAKNSADLGKVRTIAGKITDKYESNFISDFLNKAENEITERARPSENKEKLLKIIRKDKQKFGELEGGKRFYSPEKYVDAFRDINEDAEKLFETKLLYGKRSAIKNYYERFKDAIKETFHAYAPKEFADLFDQTNRNFSSLKKIEEFDEVMKSVSTEEGKLIPSKLSKLLRSSKEVNFLKGKIGERGVRSLKDISYDLSRSEKNLNLLKSPGFADLIKTHTGNMVLDLLSIPTVGAIRTTKEAIQYARGFMLDDAAGKKDVVNLLRAIRSGKEKIIKASLLKLDEASKRYEEENPID